jgi:uncharacterized protein (DUF1501 family)
MAMEAQLVDALREHVGTGVLGRMLDVLGTEGYNVGPFGIDREAPILEGDAELARQVDVIRNSGAEPFYPRKVSDVSEADMIDHFKTLNGASELNSGLFANLFSKTFVNSANKTEFLRQVASDDDLTQAYRGSLGEGLKMVSKLILSHAERNTNRDAFFIQLGGYDTHESVRSILDFYKFPDLEKGIRSFYKEMKVAGMLENVTFVLGSEFGRVSFDEVRRSIERCIWKYSHFSLSTSSLFSVPSDLDPKYLWWYGSRLGWQLFCVWGRYEGRADSRSLS